MVIFKNMSHFSKDVRQFHVLSSPEWLYKTYIHIIIISLDAPWPLICLEELLTRQTVLFWCRSLETLLFQEMGSKNIRDDWMIIQLELEISGDDLGHNFQKCVPGKMTSFLFPLRSTDFWGEKELRVSWGSSAAPVNQGDGSGHCSIASLWVNLITTSLWPH